MNYMNQSWWKGPEYNGIKVIVIVLVVALAGYFAYNGVQSDSLGNTAQLGKGKNPGGKGSILCVDGMGSYALTVAKVGTSIPTSVTTSVGGVAKGRWITIRVTNPLDCPVQVSNMEFELTSNYYTLPSPIQNLELVHVTTSSGAGTRLNGMRQVPGTPLLPDMPTVLVPSTGPSASKLPFIFSFPGTSSVTIGPGGTAVFRLISDSQNVDTGSGTKNFALQMTRMVSSNIYLTSDQRVSTGTLPATIKTPLINIY